MELKEMIAVMQAAERGETIQFFDSHSSKWLDIKWPTWNFNSYKYRVKPEPPKPREFWINIYPGGLTALHESAAGAERGLGSCSTGKTILVREVL